MFGALVAWHLGELDRKIAPAIGSLPWIFLFLQLVDLALSWKYFPPRPIILHAFSSPLIVRILKHTRPIRPNYRCAQRKESAK